MPVTLLEGCDYDRVVPGKDSLRFWIPELDSQEIGFEGISRYVDSNGMLFKLKDSDKKIGEPLLENIEMILEEHGWPRVEDNTYYKYKGGGRCDVLRVESLGDEEVLIAFATGGCAASNSLEITRKKSVNIGYAMTHVWKEFDEVANSYSRK
jgi:hypothetical protein